MSRSDHRIFLGLALGACLALTGAPVSSETVTYTYDEFGQMKSATSSMGPTVTYTYDAAGNRTQLTSNANQPPVAVNDNISVTLNTPKTFDPRTNDSDPEANPLTVTAKTNGTNGTVAINGGTSLTYTPMTNYTGADSFTYTISDGQGGTATATVSATVAGAANQAPIALNDSITRCSGVFPTSAMVNVIANDTDPDANPLTVTAVTSPATISNNQVWFSGLYQGNTYTEVYTISDGNGGTDTANVTVIVKHWDDC